MNDANNCNKKSEPEVFPAWVQLQGMAVFWSLLAKKKCASSEIHYKH